MARVLVLFAHPAMHRSIANRALADAIRDLPGVVFHDLYETYPDMLIDIEAEQDQILRADAIVVQHPLYWYSAPAIVKEWLDVVLEHGFAYGGQGRALAGKPWLQAVTSGGGAGAYGPGGPNRFTIAELLRPFEATAALCRAEWRTPHAVHGAHQMSPRHLADAAAAYRARIEDLTRAPPSAAAI